MTETNCMFEHEHGTPEEPIWFLVGVSFTPHDDLPRRCVCGAAFHYDPAGVAFVTAPPPFGPEEMVVRGTTPVAAERYVAAFLESLAQVEAEDEARAAKLSVDGEEG